MKSVIIAGGSGTRLWPLSRKNFPKQFLKLNSSESLLRQSVQRLKSVLENKDILIITNNNYRFHIKSDLNFLPDSNIILEPVGKNTAPAIALAVKYCMEKLKCSEDEVIFVCPSDHIIKPVEDFANYIKQAEKLANENFIVTFGIKPERPETGYGYIKTQSKEEKIEGVNYYKVEDFVEKPDLQTAQRYFDEGNYYWNSGMFAFKIKTILEEFEKYAPEIFKQFAKKYDEMVAEFDTMPEISIDYAIAEKSRKVVTLPVKLYWNDIGSWDSLYDVFDKDKDGNVKVGDIIEIDSKNNFIFGSKKLITTIGLEDCIIIDTDDALLISKRGEAQKVKDIVSDLKKNNRKEAVEHLTTYRPWGSYAVLEEGEKYKIKNIIVNPGFKLSLQKHKHRSEHWVVVEGQAKVTIEDKELIIHKNESVYVPKTSLHRLENPGQNPLKIIEVQNGDYVGEDDIIRIEDDFGRN